MIRPILALARRSLAPVGAAIAVLLGAGIEPPLTTARGVSSRPLSQRSGLRPGQQLAAMRAGLGAAPGTFAPAASGCTHTTPMLAYDRGGVLGGNFRDQNGRCYVWLNLAHSPLLTAREICKLALHEAGHQFGLRHSADPDDVMYSPFRAQPVPAACAAPL
jgi:hypothetical protein